MASKISVVINTFNEEKNIERAIKSVQWADEVLVCDMYSNDQTVEISKKLGAKVVFHEQVGFVEPARNFAIKQAKHPWVLILDADEEVSPRLKEELIKVASAGDFDLIEIPRKNIIFNKWMKASMWWPDYHIRFFKQGHVIWENKIHSKPKTKGEKLIFPEQEEFGIIHNHYTNVSQFLERMNRYTSVQAKELIEDGYRLNWRDVLIRPCNEFFSRFFANRGFEDGLHGLALSLLQAFSFMVVYLKVWEHEKFTEQKLSLSEVKLVSYQMGKDLEYWFRNSTLSKNAFKRFLQKVGNKIS